MSTINDPTRVIAGMAAAMIWLGLDPIDSDALSANKSRVLDCLMYLSQAAENGEIRYYDKRLFQEIPIGDTQRVEKVFSYSFTMQSLLDFAKLKNHRLQTVSREKTADALLEKPLSTTERTTLLTIIAALCDYSEIKYQERGAAAQIARLTEASGAPVSEDAIGKALKKIPNAMKDRMK